MILKNLFVPSKKTSKVRLKEEKKSNVGKNVNDDDVAKNYWMKSIYTYGDVRYKRGGSRWDEISYIYPFDDKKCTYRVNGDECILYISLSNDVSEEIINQIRKCGEGYKVIKFTSSDSESNVKNILQITGVLNEYFIDYEDDVNGEYGKCYMVKRRVTGYKNPLIIAVFRWGNFLPTAILRRDDAYELAKTLCDTLNNTEYSSGLFDEEYNRIWLVDKLKDSIGSRVKL